MMIIMLLFVSFSAFGSRARIFFMRDAMHISWESFKMPWNPMYWGYPSQHVTSITTVFQLFLYMFLICKWKIKDNSNERQKTTKWDAQTGSYMHQNCIIYARVLLTRDFDWNLFLALKEIFRRRKKRNKLWRNLKNVLSEQNQYHSC